MTDLVKFFTSTTSTEETSGNVDSVLNAFCRKFLNTMVRNMP